MSLDLDEIEYRAAYISEAGYPLHDQEAVDLAGALLLVLPTIRAAIRWRDCDEDPAVTECTHDDLADAIDALRGKGE